MPEPQQLADLATVRAALREEVNGRLDRLNEQWERRFREHMESCGKLHDQMEGRIKNGDRRNREIAKHYSDDFHKFLEEEWQPIKRVVLDAVAWMKLTGKLVASMVALMTLIALSFGVLTAVGIL